MGVSKQKARKEGAVDGADLEEACGLLARQVKGMCITTWGKNGSIMQVNGYIHFYVCTQGTCFRLREWAWRHHEFSIAYLHAVTIEYSIFARRHDWRSGIPLRAQALSRIADCMPDGWQRAREQSTSFVTFNILKFFCHGDVHMRAQCDISNVNVGRQGRGRKQAGLPSTSLHQRV